LPGAAPYAVGHFTEDGPDMEMWGGDHDAEPVLRAALHGHLELIRCKRPFYLPVKMLRGDALKEEVGFGLHTPQAAFFEAVDASLRHPGHSLVAGVPIFSYAGYHEVTCQESGEALAVKTQRGLA